MDEHQCSAEGENKSIFGVTNQLSSPWLPTVFHNFPGSQMIQNDLGNNSDQIPYFIHGETTGYRGGKIVWLHSPLMTHQDRTQPLPPEEKTTPSQEG